MKSSGYTRVLTSRVLTQHVIAIPITHGPMELLNVAIFRSWPEKEGTSASDIVHGCDKEEVRAHFIGWEDEVQQIVEVRSNTHTIMRCDV